MSLGPFTYTATRARVDAFLAQLGVAVALGVILDTMIVRSVLVTAINMDLGGKIWWPSNLDREDHHLTVEEVRARGPEVS